MDKENRENFGNIPIVAYSRKKTTRREFSFGMASFLLALFVDLERIVAFFNEKYRENIIKKQMIKKLFFGETDSHYYTPSFDNPYCKIDGITEPTKDALFRFWAHIGIDQAEIGEITSSGNPIMDGSLLLLGGPVPNPLTRNILGTGNGSPLFSQILQREFHFPIHFSNICTANARPGNRPNYKLLVLHNGIYKSAELDESRDDFLVITSIPNVFSKNYILGHRLVNVSGFHGGGTRALDLVLQDGFFQEFFNRICESNEFKNAPGWQAGIRVKIDKNNRGMPIAIDEWLPKKINLNGEDYDKIYTCLHSNPATLWQNNL